jgi:hypothetical protein
MVYYFSLDEHEKGISFMTINNLFTYSYLTFIEQDFIKRFHSNPSNCPVQASSFTLKMAILLVLATCLQQSFRRRCF